MRSLHTAIESRPRTPQQEQRLYKDPTQPKITKKKTPQTSCFFRVSPLSSQGRPLPGLEKVSSTHQSQKSIPRNFPLVPASSSSAPQAHHLSLKRDSSVSHSNKYVNGQTNTFFFQHAKHHPTFLCNDCFPSTPLPLTDLDYISNLCSQQNNQKLYTSKKEGIKRLS